ncbi:sucrase ferredoxin [Corynebacterium choanae]|uniref:Sucrase/ferredoxin-like protein n=1 Tax=Corynebacterium choanae TaxID=1862358 RepID=A0A3G6J402_9CORY|nr:sucrase ferredoxin [Corynebacterium choanae]AZA12659.1 Sucrase/ferredoxin-like protein [Corynebacterium choanae]
MQHACSDSTVEPLPGTARTGRMFVAMEHPGPWSRDILDGGTLTDTDRFRDIPGLMLIRRPGREGRHPKTLRRIYLIYPSEGIIETLLAPEETVPTLDFTDPGRNTAHGATVLDEPLLLVCTHAKRDQCCAVKGRPIVAAAAEAYPAAHVWECSHAGGHRFAPAVLLYPWGYSYGQLNEQATIALLRAAYRGEMFLPGNRGSTLFDQPGQVRELAVAHRLAAAGESLHFGDLTVNGDIVTHRDGRRFTVTVTASTVDEVVVSCGKPPTTKTSYRATQVTPLPEGDIPQPGQQ